MTSPGNLELWIDNPKNSLFFLLGSFLIGLGIGIPLLYASYFVYQKEAAITILLGILGIVCFGLSIWGVGTTLNNRRLDKLCKNPTIQVMQNYLIIKDFLIEQEENNKTETVFLERRQTGTNFYKIAAREIKQWTISMILVSDGDSTSSVIIHKISLHNYPQSLRFYASILGKFREGQFLYHLQKNLEIPINLDLPPTLNKIYKVLLDRVIILI